MTLQFHFDCSVAYRLQEVQEQKQGDQRPFNDPGSRDMLRVWTSVEAEERIGLEAESIEPGHSLADGENE